jgi:hypothetical protein
MKTILIRTGLVVLFLGTILYYWGRPLPINQREEVYPCTVYYRKVHTSPRIFIAHILTVDLTCENVEFLVTPPDKKKADLPVMARTTTEFAKEFGVQIAINGDAFHPWWSKGLFDYFPHKHDYVTSDGRSASRGATYGANNGIPIYISKQNEVSFVAPKGGVYNAISGRGWLLKNKELVEDLNDQFTAPRTSLGVDASGSKLILIIVDGRQPLYSEGVTIKEMADIMLEYGGENAINLDGGGSSTLVITDPKTGKVRVMNSPIDRYIPGNERYIANHLGLFIK